MIGGLRYSPTENTTIRYNFVSGKENPTGDGLYNKFGQYLVWEQKLNSKWDYALQYSMTYDDNGSMKNGMANKV